MRNFLFEEILKTLIISIGVRSPPLPSPPRPVPSRPIRFTRISHERLALLMALRCPKQFASMLSASEWRGRRVRV